MIENHAVFQGHNFFHHLGLDRNKRDMFAGHPHYERTAEFIERYDNPAFDPDGEILPIETFEPMVRRLFAQPRRSVYMNEESSMANDRMGQ
ncbi:hypothetical protein D9M71_430150 [compost metagenome]